MEVKFIFKGIRQACLNHLKDCKAGKSNQLFDFKRDCGRFCRLHRGGALFYNDMLLCFEEALQVPEEVGTFRRID